MSQDERFGRFGIPQPVGEACGLFTGAMVGWRAGEAIGKMAAEQLPLGLEHHADLVGKAVGTISLFGCGYTGFLLAARKPEEALLVAAAGVVSQIATKQMASAVSTAAVTPAPTVLDGSHDTHEAPSFFPDDMHTATWSSSQHHMNHDDLITTADTDANVDTSGGAHESGDALIFV